ncbi:MAG TPA: S-layer homology domain-containing protein [Leptolyngbyaceae cyanobacterium]
MTRFHHTLTACFLGFSLFASGCAGSPLGSSLQRSLEADPQLAENPPFGGGADESSVEASASTPTTTPVEAPSSADLAPEPGQPNFVGPVQSSGQNPGIASTATASPGASSAPSRNVSQAELAAVPEELRPYVGDLLALNLLTISPAPNSPSKTNTDVTAFKPSQTITRSDYARWLLTVNNLFYQNQPDKKIRAGIGSSQAAFKDVPPSHPDFAAIQGLAEAGIIPSALSGNSTAVNFRPEDPLTRKDLILWKVPLDIRESLPPATAEAVKESWGFQDAGKIDPLTLRAVLADYQNGEFSNIRRAFSYTTLFQPNKAVTQAEAAAVLWRFGTLTEGVSAQQIRQNGSPTAASSEDKSPSAGQ